MLVTVCTSENIVSRHELCYSCFLFLFSGECHVSECGEVRVPRELLKRFVYLERK
jgi:hypothetical protein